MCKIKWVNKLSQESGFVASISEKEKHFNNTFDESAAKEYKSEKSANAAIAKLVAFGEAEMNDFVIV